MSRLFDPVYMGKAFLILLRYLPTTLWMSVVCMLLAFCISAVVAVVRMKRVPVLDPLARLYVLVIRACPLMIQLYVVYFGIPVLLLILEQGLGIRTDVRDISSMTFAVIALSVNYGAYISEVLRAALLGVDKGQMEAAQAVGMTWMQGMRRIVLVQAAIFALPSMTGQFLNLVKGTAIVFTISVVELMAGAKLEAADSYRYFEVYVVVSLIYWGICLGVEALSGLASRKTEKYVKG